MYTFKINDLYYTLSGLQNERAEDPNESSIKEYDNSFDESFELHAEMIPFNVTNLIHPTSTAAFGSFKVGNISFSLYYFVFACGEIIIEKGFNPV